MPIDVITTAEIETKDEIAVDPVCGSIIDVELARDRDVIVEFADREYAFCGGTCFRRFIERPMAYAVTGRSQS